MPDENLADENRKVLFDMGSCPPLLKLLVSEDRVVRRNAVMALSVMSANNEIRAFLRDRPETITMAIKLLGPEGLFSKIFSSEILTMLLSAKGT